MGTGRLFVISAPSGTGKTTIIKRVMARMPGLVFAISHTTRQARPNELDGVDYSFVSRDEFQAMIGKGQFAEYAEVYDNLYGTSHAAIDLQFQKGFDVVLDIDVQGASLLRKTKWSEAIHIFIYPPSLVELERRLRGRGTESDAEMAVRLYNAKIEMDAADNYEYLVENDTVEKAIDLLVSIIITERGKVHRLTSGRSIGNIVNP